jgi:hypothetical protein
MSKTIAMIFGWIFIILGIVGFFNNPILGIFAVDTIHNVIHLLSGIIFVWVAYSMPMKSMGLLKVFGIIYLLVALLGFFSSGMILGLVTVNGADNWLHVVLALVFLWGGFMGGKSASASMPMGGQPQM